MKEFTGTYIVGVCSCWYYGVPIWTGLFWPWYIGSPFLKVGG
jgi:hypothetical protein